MTYDERITFLKSWFKLELAVRFNMPRDLDPTVVAMDIIESMNRNIPNKITQEQMSSLVALTAKEVTQSARTRTLPSVKEILDALRTSTQRTREPQQDTSNSFADTYQLNANRIRLGEPVSETYLKGDMKKKLINEYKLKEEDFDKYYIESNAHMQ